MTLFTVVLTIFNKENVLEKCLTRREQEIPHFYKWWDELR